MFVVCCCFFRFLQIPGSFSCFPYELIVSVWAAFNTRDVEFDQGIGSKMGSVDLNV